MKIRLHNLFPGPGLPKALTSNYPGLLTVTNWLMGFLLIFVALVLVRDIVALSFRKVQSPARVTSYAVRAPRKSLQEYASIVRNNPFGAPGGELKQLSASDGDSAGTYLSGLTLVGTVSGPQKYGYAIFVDKNNNQEVFKIGDTVHAMGILQGVEKDKVVLFAGGRAVEVPIIDAVSQADSGAPQGGPATPFAMNTGEGSYIVDQRKVKQALERPAQMMTDARLLPNVVNGKQQGFSISEIKPDGIYQSLGLQNGDVLLRINDFNISSTENALQAFMALKGMDKVNLDIIRGGNKMTMNYMIR
ncbi:MAG TPA: type II secretion system protein N [Dissulfurispiraceae bacterium]|nr:type II secretion system protein N [Dissulfurispiraceae bacterium]